VFTRILNKIADFVFPNPVVYFGENNMRASIITLDSGRFGLATPEGIVGSYSRRRDAVRGAKRAGLTLVA
jgi:hypothetical protein